MMNYAKRGAALLLALVFCLGLLPPAGAEGDTITIHDASGLLKLAQSCTSDTWSQGVTVVLAADISLAGTGFSTIPVFRGTFDGAGHTISGFAWLDKGSKVGLFRTLGEGAVVKNLILDGVVAPGGSQSQVGILAGENHGTVEQVTVTGDVTGDEDVGALVGVNGSSGVVRSCTNRASVTGNTNSGGIAGRNEGMIQSCTNLGSQHWWKRCRHQQRRHRRAQYRHRGRLHQSRRCGLRPHRIQHRRHRRDSERRAASLLQRW